MNTQLSQAFYHFSLIIYSIIGLIVSWYHGRRGYIIQKWGEQRQKQEAKIAYLKHTEKQDTTKNDLESLKLIDDFLSKNADQEYLKLRKEAILSRLKNTDNLTSQFDPFYWMTESDANFSRYRYDGVFYFFSSIIGFISFWLGVHILWYLNQDFKAISGGASAILVFLFVLGILGVGGKLPHVIDRGNKWY